MSARNLHRRQRRALRGFTLVELMISLVMGLIIALACIGLARTATDTFYEQARISGVEATIRTASERFRSDLSRISYMSTANVQLDPKIARPPSALGVAYRVADLKSLQGIRIEPAPDAVRKHAYEAASGLKPQDVYLAGNMTTHDVYRGVWVQAGGTGCGAGGGAQVKLNGAADPAVRRLYNGETTPAGRKTATEMAFMPHLRMKPVPTGTFHHTVQVMDMRGCYHYLGVCDVIQSAEPDTVILDLVGDTSIGILSVDQSGGDVCGSRVMEEVAVAPIQRVKWSLQAETDKRRFDKDLDGTTGENKFNLYRQVLATDGATAVGDPELIAEYGVDLKLGLVVDGSTPGHPNVTTNVDFESEDDDFAKWTGAVAETSTSFVGPQRVRSVRYRLAFRSSFPDRTADLGMPGGKPYISRYCMSTATPCKSFARVRTVISEVPLINQQKATY